MKTPLILLALITLCVTACSPATRVSKGFTGGPVFVTYNHSVRVGEYASLPLVDDKGKSIGVLTSKVVEASPRRTFNSHDRKTWYVESVEYDGRGHSTLGGASLWGKRDAHGVVRPLKRLLRIAESITPDGVQRAEVPIR